MYTVFLEVEQNSKGVVPGRHLLAKLPNGSDAERWYRDNFYKLDRSIGCMDFEPCERVKCDHVSYDLRRPVKIDMSAFWSSSHISGLLDEFVSDDWDDIRLIAAADFLENALRSNAFCWLDADELDRAASRLRNPRAWTLPMVRSSLARAKRRWEELLGK